jgi:hypothetical protein
VTLSLLLHNLVFVQRLAEVWLYFHICKLLFVCYDILFAPKTRMIKRGLHVFHLLDAETNQRICFLNVSPDEVIRSLFYNKNNDSLITVSVYASDNFSSLKCRSTRIEYVNLFSPPPPPQHRKINSKNREKKNLKSYD